MESTFFSTPKKAENLENKPTEISEFNLLFNQL
jgi:hypothetical protein